jgi:hypothetical protein
MSRLTPPNARFDSVHAVAYAHGDGDQRLETITDFDFDAVDRQLAGLGEADEDTATVQAWE